MLTFTAHWHPVVEISILGRYSLEGRQTRKIVLGSHTGTHIDAPAHFIPGGATIEKTPLNILVGKAYIVEFPQCEPLRKIDVEDVKSQISGVQNLERIVFRFDWSRFWNGEQYYKDWPYLSYELCQWLIEKNVKLVGIDTPSPDNPYDDKTSGNDSPNHKLLLRKGVILVEYLCNLEEIKTKVFELIALPLKLKNGDGSPARVIAVVDEDAGGKNEERG